MKSFKRIYDRELKIDVYTPFELIILESFTVRSFVYEICKKVLAAQSSVELVRGKFMGKKIALPF